MEKDKLPLHGGTGSSLPPSSARFSGLSATSSSFIPSKCEATSTSQVAGAVQDAEQFSHDISQMPDFPTRNVGHRRARSEILSLPDDISFDSELGVVGSGEGPSFSDDTEEDLFSMFMDMDKFASSSAMSGLDLSGTEILDMGKMPTTAQAQNVAAGSGEKPRIRHKHSQSMDETGIKPEMLSSGIEGMSLAETKKAMSAAKLADLALVDPKRAKRIWANRQSAARSKERKMRYIAELERKVQTLQIEATTISAQLAILQRDNTGLNAENSELKLRLQTMEQQVCLQDALNEALREEVQRLKLATGQSTGSGGQMLNYGQPSFGVNQQFYHYNQLQSPMATQPFLQHQMHSQHQQQIQHQHRTQPLQQQSSGEAKIRGMTPQSQREGSSESKASQE